MGMTLASTQYACIIYILRSRRNPGSVDQPWITRRNAGLFASANPGSTSDQTVDHRCRRARGPDKPFLIRSTTSMWAWAIVPDHGAGQLYNASYGTPQQTGEPLALWSDRAQRLKMGRVGPAFPALRQRWPVGSQRRQRFSESSGFRVSPGIAGLIAATAEK
jgi:hypothetical protein